MLTHGWRRFRTDSLFRTAPFRPKFFFEHGQFFSGRVNNMFGKGVGEATLTAFASRGDGLGDRAFTATTDSAGHFLFEGLDFQDTTVFLIPFYNKKGKIPYEIHFEDTYYRPGLTPLAPYQSETIREKRLEEVRRRLRLQRVWTVLQRTRSTRWWFMAVIRTLRPCESKRDCTRIRRSSQN